MVEVRIEPDVELARRVPKGLQTPLGAHVEEHLERHTPLGLQIGKARRVEIRAAVQPDKLSAQHGDLAILGNDGLPAIDVHQVLGHGAVPLLSTHLRMLATAPSSVSREGCGRWKSRTASKSHTPMREPSRSSAAKRRTEAFASFFPA
ncbi:hypothetical protein [Fulvimarina sp. 2208YS6-2-32]|uniref:hypothetical protein n=1 Tax=Fulvimarina uroteuthidis TaxID=3098149 RepID=UPI002AC96BC8|nr:hypothetical protein [Fulvimarina sp. 2208YS6-2-32]